jgi:neutral ceramidase
MVTTMKRVRAVTLIIASSAVLSFFMFCRVGLTRSALKAGFATAKITPPLGTALSGFGERDFDPAGAKGVHDDLYARALYLTQGNKEALIMGFDLLFFSREESDRFKSAIGNKIGLPPDKILLNTSHTHTGPKVGNWYYTPSDPLYLQELEEQSVAAALEAKQSVCEVTLWAGETRTGVPLSRRRPLADGTVAFAPNPAGPVDDFLPFILLKSKGGSPVCLLFSVACHPSTIKGDELAYVISADFPGAAASEIDRNLGKTAALFLQGAGGDAKPSVIGRNSDAWRGGNWEDVAAAGRMIASEIQAACSAGLRKVKPRLETALVETYLPLAAVPTGDELMAILESPESKAEDAPTHLRVRRMWTEEQLALLDRGYGLRTEVPVLVQGIQLGRGLRIIGVEGELVAEIGMLIRDFFGSGITFVLGYSNGAQMYIPTSKMIAQGGYEVESYWEYRQPAPLAEGLENFIREALAELGKAGIE